MNNVFEKEITMKNFGLTATMVFEAESANYGEGFGNISVLKKMSRRNGETYTYISRQALRYSIVGQCGWDSTPVGAPKDSKKNSDDESEGKSSGTTDKSVVQFSPDATIKDYPGIDFFGYMKTVKGSNAATRAAVARLSNAVSLEPYRADTDFLTNMGLAKRAGQQNSIAQREIHHSLYAYTITIDLDKVGIDGDIAISNEEKAKRVRELLDAIAHLYRDIAGRRESLAPVFAVGGVFERRNPYFENNVIVKNGALDVGRIAEIIKDDPDCGKNCICGVRVGAFRNEDEIKNELNAVTVGEFFRELTSRAEAAYNE